MVIDDWWLTDSGAINEDAFGEGWLFTLQMDEPGQVNELLDPDGYAELLEDEDH